MENDLRRAMAILRSHQGAIGSRNSRIHKGALADNTDRMRALEGICGQCANLICHFDFQDTRQVVRLMCKAGRRPLDLYRNTPLGQTANCNAFSNK